MKNRYKCLVVGLLLIMSFGIQARAQTLHTLTVKVHLDGNVIDPLYDDDNQLDPGEVRNLTLNSLCFQGEDYNNTDSSITIEACDGDVLTFDIIDPNLYRTSPFGQVSFDRWEVNGSSKSSTAYFEYEVSGMANLDAYLTQTISEIQGDPVTARWNPDAGHRSGGGLTWGPGYQTATSQVTGVSSDAYPALLYSGEAYEKQVDLAVGGRGLDFVFSRVHRSGAPDGDIDDDGNIDSIGFNGQWTHGYDIIAQATGSGTTDAINVTLGNGTRRTFRFKYNDFTTRYYYSPGWDAELRLVFEVLSNPFPAHYELVFGDGVSWVFPTFNYDDLETTPTSVEGISDRFGNTMSFAYDGSGRLETITDTLGREYTIAYVPGKDLIDSLTEEDGLGRVISYGYNGSDQLTSVTYPATAAFPNPNERKITYAYDTDSRLTTVTDPRGTDIITNSYTDGVLTSQEHGEGAEAATVAFGYSGLTLLEGESHAVRVTDGAGHKTEHYFNGRNQLVRLVRLDESDATFTTTTIAWAEHMFAGSTVVSDDQPEIITLPDGITVTYTYAGPGAVDADYKYRMNPTQITRTGPDGKSLVEEFGHSPFGGTKAFWDARFGDSFVTCHALRDGFGVLLGATAYTYSSDDTATLDGIDFYGISPYASDPFAACQFSGGSSSMLGSGLGSMTFLSFLETETSRSTLCRRHTTHPRRADAVRLRWRR